jgi:hypothetical protein
MYGVAQLMHSGGSVPYGEVPCTQSPLPSLPVPVQPGPHAGLRCTRLHRAHLPFDCPELISDRLSPHVHTFAARANARAVSPDFSQPRRDPSPPGARRRTVVSGPARGPRQPEPSSYHLRGINPDKTGEEMVIADRKMFESGARGIQETPPHEAVPPPAITWRREPGEAAARSGEWFFPAATRWRAGCRVRRAPGAG